MYKSTHARLTSQGVVAAPAAPAEAVFQPAPAVHPPPGFCMPPPPNPSSTPHWEAAQTRVQVVRVQLRLFAGLSPSPSPSRGVVVALAQGLPSERRAHPITVGLHPLHPPSAHSRSRSKGKLGWEVGPRIDANNLHHVAGGGDKKIYNARLDFSYVKARVLLYLPRAKGCMQLCIKCHWGTYACVPA